MRNFEERMDEIRKRSHARILRRRKQLTDLCVPLIAVLCVGGALLIPRQTTYQNDTTVPTDTTAVQYSGSVTVVNGNVTVSYSSRNTVESVRHLVSSLPPVEIPAMDVVQRYNHQFAAQTAGLTTNYTIILETEEGAAHYKLLGKILSNQDTNEMFTLTETQRAELLKLLGLN